ncbi:hypothetical protein [Flavobacterium psychrophilum]|uniref:Uncharacterized protein n=1 Tax=Flavobacterium psychrophilum TaxID=96345 RepID=A0A7U2NFC5_FLAPS|nr:hypothetical protein [Flavobacterium psychrophilum]OAE92113.1 hypothetical protein SU65_10175 [Flavobacterium psychrophilum]QRE04180.1 hypothetical protein H0H26_00815 [Flavobacterium psychrophilum]
MKKPKKITISHYLYKNVKPNKNGYLVYVSVTVNRYTTKLKSSIENRFFDTETMHKVAFKEIQNEKSELEKTIKAKLLIDNNFTFKQPKRPIIVNKQKIVNQLENEILRLKRICKNQDKRIKELEQYNLFATN